MSNNDAIALLKELEMSILRVIDVAHECDTKSDRDKILTALGVSDITGYAIRDDAMTLRAKQDMALDTILRYGQIDGGHHKTWVLDQVVRTLTGDGYEQWVKNAKGEEYDWDEGIAP